MSKEIKTIECSCTTCTYGEGSLECDTCDDWSNYKSAHLKKE